MTDQRETLPQLAVMVPADLKRQNGARREWIEGSYNLCIHLNAARRQHKGNTAFGKWCSDNEFGEDELDEHGKHVLNADTRAAAVAMGAAPEALRASLEETERHSLEQIHRKEFNETRLRDIPKTSSGKEEEMVKDGSQKQRIIELYEKAGAEGISSPEVVAELGIPSKSVGRSLSELKTEGVLVATNMTHGKTKAAVLVHRDFATEAMTQPPEDQKESKKKRRKLGPLNRYERPLVPSSKVTLKEAGFPVDDPHGIDPETGLLKVQAYVRKNGHGTGMTLEQRISMEDHKSAVRLPPQLNDLFKTLDTAISGVTAFLRSPQPQAATIVPMSPTRLMEVAKDLVSGERVIARVRERLPKVLAKRLELRARIEEMDAYLDDLVDTIGLVDAPPAEEPAGELVELFPATGTEAP